MIFTKSKNTYFATPKDNPKDKISLEVGDSKQPDFKPQQKIMRWDNEVNVSLRLVHDEVSPTVSKSGEKITWEGKKVKAEIYPLTEDEGGQEFEITLKEKPKSNVVQFTLVDKGIEYFYQPFLKNTNPDGSFWEENEGSGRIECPANVGGSYAIYASENKINYVGGKEYKCGKVGHIYRPKIIDSAGTEVWGELNIKDGILSVTIPQDFLDNAVYPVRHAAGLTFGYSTNGSSYVTGYSANRPISGGDTFTGGAGSGTSMSIYASKGSSNINLQMGVYDNASPKNLIANAYTGSVAINSTVKWWSANFATAPTFSAISYRLVFNCSATSYNIYCDSSGVSDGCQDPGVTFGTWPSTLTLNATWNGNYKYSIYATYTAGSSSSIKSINGLAKASIKSINGLAIASVKSFNGLT